MAGPRNDKLADDSASFSQQPLEPAPANTLLAQVLQETLASLELDSPEVLESIFQVVRQHHGEPLTLDPVAIDLVRAIMKHRLRAVPASEPFWQAAPRLIAETLVEDPVSHQRLQTFWARARETLS